MRTCSDLLATLDAAGDDRDQALWTLATAVVELQKENADLRAAVGDLLAKVGKSEHSAVEAVDQVKKAIAEMG